jgi:hypothetical protein
VVIAQKNFDSGHFELAMTPKAGFPLAIFFARSDILLLF